MSHQRGAKTKKSKKNRVVDSKPKTRHHSNLRPKTKKSSSFLKVYHPYLPLMVISLVILALLQPWNLTAKNNGVLSYATEISRTSLVKTTNSVRESNDREPLDLNSKLNKAAQAKAEDMVKNNYWSHDRPDGQAPWVFVSNAGYQYKKAGENLAYGFNSSGDVIAGWLNSPSHKANVLDRSYEDVGFGFSDSPNFDNNGPSTVVVAMYASNSSTQSITANTDSDKPDSFSTTLGDNTKDVPQVSISRIQAFTGGSAPWMPYAIGFVIGALALYLLLHHGMGIKRALRDGEKFVMKHPLLDATFISLIVLGWLVLQQTGVIR